MSIPRRRGRRRSPFPTLRPTSRVRRRQRQRHRHRCRRRRRRRRRRLLKLRPGRVSASARSGLRGGRIDRMSGVPKNSVDGRNRRNGGRVANLPPRRRSQTLLEISYCSLWCTGAMRKVSLAIYWRPIIPAFFEANSLIVNQLI